MQTTENSAAAKWMISDSHKENAKDKTAKKTMTRGILRKIGIACFKDHFYCVTARIGETMPASGYTLVKLWNFKKQYS